MNNKNGFTLTEVLAVIALIGVILLLVVPNVTVIFRNAKKSLFQDEALSVYNNTFTTYVYRSSNGDYTKRFCSGKNGNPNKIDIEDKEGFYYDVEVNSNGEIISLKVTNGDFGITLSDSNGVKKKNIKTDSIGDAFDIVCDDTPAPVDPALVCIITNTNKRCNVFDFSHNVIKGVI